MFETAILSYGPPTKRVWSTALGFTGQAMLIGCALLAPMVFPQTLGQGLLSNFPDGARPAASSAGAPGSRVIPRGARPRDPRKSPGTSSSRRSVFLIERRSSIDEPPVVAGSGTGVAGGMVGGDPQRSRRRCRWTRSWTEPRVPRWWHAPRNSKAAPVAAAPVVKAPRITQLQMATPIRRVDPIYPKLAIAAHVSGTVELLGVLGADGRIHELKVLRGHPLLIKAAMDAVRQWIYEPTLLNGQAVEVSAPIMVNFILR